MVLGRSPQCTHIYNLLLFLLFSTLYIYTVFSKPLFLHGAIIQAILDFIICSGATLRTPTAYDTTMWPFNHTRSKPPRTPPNTSEDPPPPYPDAQSTLENFFLHVMKEDLFLSLSLIEIMAVTFNADFTQIQAAMKEYYDLIGSQVPFPPVGSSVMLASGRAALEDLCALIRKLEKKLRRNEWITTTERERNIVMWNVIIPAHQQDLPADYVLEVMGRYADAKLKRRKGTMVDHWMPWCAVLRKRSKSPMKDLGDTLISHSSLIESITPTPHCEPIRLVLGKAMARYKRRRGIRELQHTGRDICGPISGGYMDLYKKLHSIIVEGL
ncbi:hypothetical protein BDV95DRAFT_215968 [Massariosphaeria phaeospora]|uniref:Uncharacterized protein n=1 Tax=Massariosphaeria phaeospora TaxID=100035 RepID=A0A7C8M827_9PLEO|nr:hypothetical protein BDV95DRAFT_215968 [Massariosphaeria phaeospora]